MGKLMSTKSSQTKRNNRILKSKFKLVSDSKTKLQQQGGRAKPTSLTPSPGGKAPSMTSLMRKKKSIKIRRKRKSKSRRRKIRR